MDGSRLIRYIAYSLELYLLFVLQQTPGLFPAIFGARPVLLFPLAISIAILEREMPAMVFGSVVGLLVDFGYGGALGFHALLLALICFFVSILCHTVLRVNLGTAVLMAVCTFILLVLMGWLYQFVGQGYAHAAYALWRHYVPKYFYTLIMFPLIFLLTRGISKALASPE